MDYSTHSYEHANRSQPPTEVMMNAAYHDGHECVTDNPELDIPIAAIAYANAVSRHDEEVWRLARHWFAAGAQAAREAGRS